MFLQSVGVLAMVVRSLAGGGPEFVSSSALVDRLRADDVAFNAMGAMELIRESESPPISELFKVLDSDDYQQRQLSAELLWEFIEPWGWLRDEERERRKSTAPEITRRLIEVTVEGLQDDSLPYDRKERSYTYCYNMKNGIRVLSMHAWEAREVIASGLMSDDEQQRYACGLIAGIGRLEHLADEAAVVLLPHLRDNDIRDDAYPATAALYRLGPGALPRIVAARCDADVQQAMLIDLLVLDFQSPPETREELEDRKRFNVITGLVFDPAVEGPREWGEWVGEK